MNVSVRRWHLVTFSVVTIIITASHYTELLTENYLPGYLLATVLGLSRHAFERFLYVLLVAYAGWFLGTKFGIAALGIVLLAMFPRAIWLSSAPKDALLEVVAAAILSGLFLLMIHIVRRWQKDREALMSVVVQLKESEAEYRELFDNASDAIWVHDLEGKITQANKAAERLSGYDISELIGKNVRDLFSPESYSFFHEVETKLLAGQSLEPKREHRLLRKNGSEAVIELSMRLIAKKGSPCAFQCIARDVTEDRKMRDSLRFYLQSVLEAQEAERKRLARDLHDDTAQALLFIVHQLDSIISDRSLCLEPKLSERLSRLYRLAKEAHDNLRRYTKQLRPAILDDIGLGPALEWLAENLMAETEADVVVQLGSVPPDLPHEVQLTLFRVAQEALSNVKRHAGASQVGIRLTCLGELLRMTVSDNGRGFEAPAEISDFGRRGKLGLLGIQERVKLLGGEFRVQSVPGRGTTITVEVPVYPRSLCDVSR